MEARCAGSCEVGCELEIERSEGRNEFSKEMLNGMDDGWPRNAYGVTIIGGRFPSGVRRS